MAQLTKSQAELLRQAKRNVHGVVAVVVGHSTRSGRVVGFRASEAARQLRDAGLLEWVGSFRDRTGRDVTWRLTEAGRAAATNL